LYAVTGVATAFAARDILGNILSGFSLQFSRPFSVGDYIKVPGYLSHEPFVMFIYFLKLHVHLIGY
jgi:small-conductance mechanosensitive channel